MIKKYIFVFTDKEEFCDEDLLNSPERMIIECKHFDGKVIDKLHQLFDETGYEYCFVKAVEEGEK